MANEVGEDDLDKLLDSALDDFDCAPRVRASATPAATASCSSATEGDAPKGLGFDPLARPKKKGTAKTKSKIPSGFAQPEIATEEVDVAKIMEELMKLGVVGDGEVQSVSDGPSPQDLQATLAALAEQTQSMSSGADPSCDGDEDPLYSELLKQFGSLGDSPDMQGVMESMMQHLLSKEVLYQPLKEIEAKYPAWLDSNATTLPQEETQRYTTQHSLITQLLHVYDTQPGDYSRITELLQQMQECGQPPAELMRDLTQGVELGEDGTPKFPFGGGPNLDPEQQCTIV
mmetsp:Transcript_18194/g.39792  ORF Transcript_18194/g.39792 Transcript_18194/m.39792 type:complete len:287 (+) Transcript_18194:39-899(+)|eukprot:CAMPEP_0118924848 /NCGR_PEP_ID=MMETSP1169-20130426/2793_1 /TAXON_ID=36882 /ORGANISM="Pyramimonas obovata, Strain CCMP722" /LENGTH=286 /DNA_ID=CAMNT_0006865987 /DNA_START=39 /DNA_END=899 /DNA_ORIENTATION=+